MASGDRLDFRAEQKADTVRANFDMDTRIKNMETRIMRNSFLASAAGFALAAAMSVVLPLPSYEAAAQTAPPPVPQTAPPAAAPAAPAPTTAPAAAVPAAAPPVTITTAYYVNIVDLEIAPSSMTKFMADLADDVAGTVQEAGVHEIDSSVGQSDPNHVFIFEVYNNSAAWGSHQKTTTYAKFVGLTMMMIKTYNIRPFTATVMNSNPAAQPQTAPLFINVVETDVVPDNLNDFLTAAKANAAAAVADPGVREFNIAVSQTTPNHVLFFEVYDNAAAHEAQAATDHFKAYEATVKGMVTKGSVTPLSSVSMNAKSQ
jgi:quinol monooxygenase YgiN